MDPNFYSKNLLMLGKTYMMLKDQEKALLWLKKAQDYPAITEEDKQVRTPTRVPFSAYHRAAEFSLLIGQSCFLEQQLRQW